MFWGNKKCKQPVGCFVSSLQQYLAYGLDRRLRPTKLA